ncbi:TniQ family protein [Duganella levis]|uniref:TniQ domain-containing protein n=1 Tax=Duganella levis TaxID=2692169 RepID=A0ABW9VZ56_9BURK|nr:TniQ family protein [Duganella levis]MYN26948.1 hypothetical protein [Duganella levis]
MCFATAVAGSKTFSQPLCAPVETYPLDHILLFPTAFPDEIYTSYLGRIARCNGLSANEIKDFLSSKAFHDSLPIPSASASSLTALAMYTEKPIIEFVREHTFLPYRQGIVSNELGLVHGELISRHEITLLFNLKTTGIESRFCTFCIETDLAKYGMAYWRRLHQLPGMYMCPKHNLALRYVSTMGSLIHSPAALASRSLCYTPSLLKAAANPNVQNFLALSAVLLGTSRSTSKNLIWKTFRPIADEHGYNMYDDIGLRHKIGEEVVRAFPATWLNTIVPGPYSKGGKKLLQLIDETLRRSPRNVPASAYMLAACILPGALEKLMDLVTAIGDRRQLFPNPFVWPSTLVRRQANPFKSSQLK